MEEYDDDAGDLTPGWAASSDSDVDHEMSHLDNQASLELVAGWPDLPIDIGSDDEPMPSSNHRCIDRSSSVIVPYDNAQTTSPFETWPAYMKRYLAASSGSSNNRIIKKPSETEKQFILSVAAVLPPPCQLTSKASQVFASLFDSHLGAFPRPNTTLNNDAHKANTARKDVSEKTVNMAAAVHQTEILLLKTYFQSIESNVIPSDRFWPHSALKRMASDETPALLRIQVKAGIQRDCRSAMLAITNPVASAGTTALEDSAPGSIQPLAAPALPPVLHNARQPTLTKVFQTDLGASLMFEDIETHRFIIHRFSLPSWIQAGDQATGDNIGAMMSALWDVNGFAQVVEPMFPYTMESFMADRGSANIRYDNHAIEKSPEWLNRQRKPCENHKASTMTGAEFSLIKADTSGMVGVSLSQRATGALDLFYQCIASFLLARYRIYWDSWPADASTRVGRHRIAILDLFFGSKRQSDARAILEFFLSGTYEDDKEVGIHIPSSLGITEQTVRLALQFAVPRALCPGIVKLFPRSRWTGFSETFDDIGSLVSPHDMLKQVTPVFLACQKSKRLPTIKDFAKNSYFNDAVVEGSWPPLIDCGADDADLMIGGGARAAAAEGNIEWGQRWLFGSADDYGGAAEMLRPEVGGNEVPAPAPVSASSAEEGKKEEFA
jgi:hypothetical protein